MKSLQKRNFSKEILKFISPPIIYMIMRFIWFSTSKKFHYITPIGEEQHVCVCWHNELLMSPQAYRKVHKKQAASAIISSHSDGSIIASTLSYLDIRALRGSSKRGAKQVLFQAFKSIKSKEEVLITPDGPRGPRHHMSDGAIGIALKSKLPIFVMSYKAKDYWQLGSWDKFVIPKPFSKIDFYLQSISLDGMELDEAKEYLKDKMLENTII